MTKRFSLGIDLGTTNCAIALTDLEADQTEVLEVTQILGPNRIGERPTFPSALYIPHRDEFPENSFPLPWENETADGSIIGLFAREHGALVPDRLVTSANSWLSNAHIHPRRRSLPWGSEIEEDKLSPFECSRRYLAHLKNAFLYAGRVLGRSRDLSETEMVLTVPASFDAVARNLTAEATNCAIALFDLEADQTEVLQVAQILGPNRIGERPTFPSALYIPHRDEFPENSFPLPWENETADGSIIGLFAREHGALVPDRLVTSAKSWLSNAHIDPRRRSLPWGSEIEEDKLSPFECSRRYLAHLKNAFLYAGHVLGRSRDLSETEMVLTVPASFDAVARNLTAEAAEAAGLGKVILLEEP